MKQAQLGILRTPRVPQRMIGLAAALRVAEIADRRNMSYADVLWTISYQGHGRKSADLIANIRKHFNGNASFIPD